MQRDWIAPPAAGLGVRLQGLRKRYGERPVLHGLDLDIAPGDFVAIVGRSGCGKSTLLRLLAGLETPSAGEVRLDGVPLAVRRDDIRIMFQEARLLPWRTVLQNVQLGLASGDAAARARQALAQVGLADRADEWPAVLSGGQRRAVQAHLAPRGRLQTREQAQQRALAAAAAADDRHEVARRDLEIDTLQHRTRAEILGQPRQAHAQPGAGRHDPITLHGLDSSCGRRRRHAAVRRF